MKKEMDYKSKYEEALKRAKVVINLSANQGETQAAIETIFPELAESEDERIIDDAIQIIRASRLRCAEYGSEADKHLKAIAYLEKQKEQKPAEWSEEDKRKLNRIYEIIGWAMDEHAFSSCKKLIGDKEGVELQDFLRSIAKPTQEWSEEDEEMLKQAIKCVNNSGKLEVSTEEIEDWLKSLSAKIK